MAWARYQVDWENVLQTGLVAELDLEGRGIGDEGAAKIAELLATNTACRRLVLTDCGITDEGCSVLASALPRNKTLEFLGLQDNELTDVAATALAAGVCGGGGLKVLHVGYNDISAAGAAALLATCAHDPALPSPLPQSARGSLTSLDLQFNDLGPEAAAAIAAAIRAPAPGTAAAAQVDGSGVVLVGLTALGLLQTSLGSEGVVTVAEALGANGGNRALTSLDLGSNEAGDAGASALAAALAGASSSDGGGDTAAGPVLAHLFLFESEVGAAGAAALAGSLTSNERVTFVDLEENDDLDLDDCGGEGGSDAGGGSGGKFEAGAALAALAAGLARNRSRTVAAAAAAIRASAGLAGPPVGADGGAAIRGGEAPGENSGTPVPATAPSAGPVPPPALVLNFEGDGVGDEGCAALGAALQEAGGALRRSRGQSVGGVALVLDDCGVTEAGALDLAAGAEAHPGLVGLSLRFNPIFGTGRRGAAAGRSAAVERIEAALSRNQAARP